jgi:hypothetical protein
MVWTYYKLGFMINKKFFSLLRITGSVVFISGLVYYLKNMHLIFIFFIVITYERWITDDVT